MISKMVRFPISYFRSKTLILSRSRPFTYPYIQPFTYNNNLQSKLSIDSAIDVAWRDPFLVNLRSTQAKPGFDHLADPSFRNGAHWQSSDDVNQALSWPSAHTVFPNISSPETTTSAANQPLPSIAIRFQASQSASEHLNRFRATLFPNNFASEQLNRFRATLFPNNFASTATSLPGESTMFPNVVTTLVPINGSSISLLSEPFTILNDCRNTGSTTRSLSPKGSNIGSDQWSWFDVDAYGLSQRRLYGILIING